MAHEILREGFRGLELRGLLVRPPDAQAVLLEQVNNSDRKRVVRPDDRQVDPVLLREIEQLRQILRADANAFDRRLILHQPLQGDAGVGRRTPHPRDVRRLRELPDQGVFPPARTDDEDVH